MNCWLKKRASPRLIDRNIREVKRTARAFLAVRVSSTAHIVRMQFKRAKLWDCRLSRGIEKRERHHFCRNGVPHGFDSHLDLQRGAY
jgi:hypothetical protein